MTTMNKMTTMNRINRYGKSCGRRIASAALIAVALGIPFGAWADASDYQDIIDVTFDGVTVVNPLTIDTAYVSGAKPVAIRFSEQWTTPFSNTNRVKVATLTKGGMTAADFTDISPRKHNCLPTTWVEIEDVPDSTAQDVYIVARPVIAYDRDGTKKREVFTSGTGWSDGLVPSGGKDYYFRSCYEMAQCVANIGESGAGVSRTFGGESLVIPASSEGGGYNPDLLVYCREVIIPNLYVFGTAKIYLTSSGKGQARSLKGKIHVDDAAKGILIRSNPSRYYTWSEHKSTAIDADIDGGGVLNLSNNGIHNSAWKLYLNGDNSGFYGTLQIFAEHAEQATYINIVPTDGLAFGGPMKKLTAAGVSIKTYDTSDHEATVFFEKTMTINAANRGWTATNLVFDVAEGTTMTFAPPVFTARGTFRKTGAGTLAMGVRADGGASVSIDEGCLSAVSTNAFSTSDLSFAQGAGIAVQTENQDVDVANYGLMPKSISVVGGGKIAVSVTPPTVKSRTKFSVAICTVPTGHADLRDVLEVGKVHGYDMKFVRETVSIAGVNYDRYRAQFYPHGMLLGIW